MSECGPDFAVRLRHVMAELNVSRLTLILAVAGSTVWARCISASTNCKVRYISTLQSKNRLISAEPRLVIEVTRWSPCTVFTASSMGRVTVTSIWSMGITPLSTPTTMRGKSVSGKTAMGTENAM